jgi:hypothetical protein
MRALAAVGEMLAVGLVSAGALGAIRGGSGAEHWAYRKPEAPNLPAEAFAGWAKNPIDRFVGERLAREGLCPSSAATPAELLRRASLDLTGLPPNLAELDAFLADTASDAYERALERLFASPHYGEHQATRWLDLARYADSRGYEKDERREMWRYRDWVIGAFQRDLPFDQFTLEQLAGDLMTTPTLEQRIATGFHRNTLVNEEGGTDPEEFRVAAVKDRVNTTAMIWLGTTLECAQCHDHKYDPFTQSDYYRFFAFFDGTADTGNSDGPMIPAPTEAFAARARELESERAGLEARLTPEATASVRAEWRAPWREFESAWRVLRPTRVEASAGSTLTVLEDGSVLASGALPSAEHLRVESSPGPGILSALRIEVLLDESLPEKGPGRPSHGNFVLSRLALALDGAPVALRTPRVDYQQSDFGPAGVLDEDPRSGWAVGGAIGEAHTLVCELAEPLRLAPETRLALTLEQDYGSAHLIGRVRLAWSERALPVPGPLPAPRIAAELALETDAAEAERARWFAARAPAYEAVHARLSEIERALVPPQALVMQEAATPRTTHLHKRGNFLTPGDEVSPGVPAVLPPLPALSARPTRLDLARWLCSGENPLTARVVVNRLWARIFGTGLVATDNDFGMRGDAPSHPELLDWLALEFVARGWSQKELLRTILTSATYRQSSRTTGELLERDPANRWLARGPKLRLEAESVRDTALFVSGLLDPSVGGPSVFPPQPEGIWQSPYSGDTWTQSSGGARQRRGLYTFLKRSAPYPTFLLFDATSREVACARRGRSNTPLQALALLNDPAFVECAAALARRMELEGGERTLDRLRYGFRLCTAREPSEAELAILRDLLDSGKVAPDWRSVATVLLNLDETITKG